MAHPGCPLVSLRIRRRHLGREDLPHRHFDGAIPARKPIAHNQEDVGRLGVDLPAVGVSNLVRRAVFEPNRQLGMLSLELPCESVLKIRF